MIPLPAVAAVWDFDDAGNRLADRTGNGHDLVNPGGSSSPSFVSNLVSNNGWMPVGLGDTAADFDGGDHLAIPNAVYGGGDFTVVLAQLRPDAASGFDTLISSSRFRYQNVNDMLRGDINAPGGSFGGIAPISPDDWHLIALTYDDSTGVLNSYAITDSSFVGGPVLTGSADIPGLGDADN